MIKTIDYNSQKKFQIFVVSTFSDLKKFKNDGNKKAFNELLLKTLPQVKRYITKRLNTVLLKGELPRGKYCPDDFMGQLFIEAFDHFYKIEHKEGLYTWLFKKADNLLEDTLIDEEFHEYFFENIDDFSRPEWDAMVENFSADGDLVMLEENWTIFRIAKTITY